MPSPRPLLRSCYLRIYRDGSDGGFDTNDEPKPHQQRPLSFSFYSISLILSLPHIDLVSCSRVSSSMRADALFQLLIDLHHRLAAQIWYSYHTGTSSHLPSQPYFLACYTSYCFVQMVQLMLLTEIGYWLRLRSCADSSVFVHITFFHYLLTTLCPALRWCSTAPRSCPQCRSWTAHTCNGIDCLPLTAWFLHSNVFVFCWSL